MKTNSPCIITVDLGTSSVRAALIDNHLKISKQSGRPVSIDTDAEGKAEQDTNELLAAAVTCITEVANWAELSGYPVEALSFSNASASLVCLDHEFLPLRPALTYADLRASQESELLIKTYGKDQFRLTGAPIHASYWLPKFLWLRNNGFLDSKSRYFCTIKDLFVYHLTGRFVTDSSNAAATGMCNAVTGNWDGNILDIAGIRLEQLPQIHHTTTVLAISRQNNPLKDVLPGNCRIVLGAMDGVLSNLGAGAFKPGQVTTTIGSSGACRIAAKSPLLDQSAVKIWSYPLDKDIWIRGGAMNNGGLVTQWLAENFSSSDVRKEDRFQSIFDLASEIEPGADGLIFLPYLFGERAPIYDEHARGVYFGLHSSHKRAHLVRAGIEGILFAMYSIFELLQTGESNIEAIRASGGYLRSDLMLQIQADIFGKPIKVPDSHEGSLIGAALLAQKALGKIDSYDQRTKDIKISRQVDPNLSNAKKYEGVYPHFVALYSHLKPLFSQSTL